MKLLSVSLPAHDANLAYFDGDQVRYLKLERLKQHKRFHLAALPDWESEVAALWGDAAAAPDDCVFSFDPYAIPEALRDRIDPGIFVQVGDDAAKAVRLPPALCEHLGVRHGWLIGHHYSHARSTWMLEPRPADVRIVIDGVGDGRPWSVYRGDRLVAGGDLRKGSVGWGMREMGRLLGVQAGHYNDIAGKVMGLQAWGRVDAGYLDRLRGLGMDQLRELWAVQPWHAHKGDPLVGGLSLLDWAATVHVRMGELLVAFFGQFAHPGEVVAYSGGVAQNVVWNTQLRAAFPHLVIPPHASDEGLALGALDWLREHHGLPPLAMPRFPAGQSDVAVAEPSERTVHLAAQFLAQGRVLGWYQGPGEIGPRALGQRSLFLDPRLPQGKERINRVKRREPYRPFGASVLAEHFDAHFEGPADGFMLYACRPQPGRFPAITHVDGSCRVQRVGPEDTPLRRLLLRFHQFTGCPVLLNTSLNLAGRPIAGHPDTARQLFAEAAIDAMVIGDELLHR